MNKNNEINYCLDVNNSYNTPCIFYKKYSRIFGWDFICSFNSKYEAFIYADINDLKEVKKDGDSEKYTIYYE